MILQEDIDGICVSTIMLNGDSYSAMRHLSNGCEYVAKKMATLAVPYFFVCYFPKGGFLL